jgi:hypothetical protein
LNTDNVPENICEMESVNAMIPEAFWKKS